MQSQTAVKHFGKEKETAETDAEIIAVGPW